MNETLKVGGISGEIYAGSATNCINRINIKIFFVENAGGNCIAAGITGSLEKSAVFGCRNMGNVNLSGKMVGAATGGIAGVTVRKSEISNSFNSGNVLVEPASYYARTGGITGVLDDGFVIRCGNSGEINALSNGPSTKTGGLMGEMSGSRIEESFNSGYIWAGIDYVFPDELRNKLEKNKKFVVELANGGTVGYFSGGSIMNVYNTGAISGKLSVEGSSAIVFLGGIVGIEVPFNGLPLNDPEKSKKAIQNSFNVGNCEIESWNGDDTLHGTGGIVGMGVEETKGKIKIENSYWMENKGSAEGVARTNGKDESAMLSAEDFKNPENFKGWDFETVWAMSQESPEYPVLRNLATE
jgi:hypothetical protein